VRQGLPGGSLAIGYFGDPRTPVELAKLGKHVEWEETNKGQTALRSNDEKTNLEGKLE
jgi:hypothetical protein